MGGHFRPQPLLCLKPKSRQATSRPRTVAAHKNGKAAPSGVSKPPSARREQTRPAAPAWWCRPYRHTRQIIGRPAVAIGVGRDAQSQRCAQSTNSVRNIGCPHHALMPAMLRVAWAPGIPRRAPKVPVSGLCVGAAVARRRSGVRAFVCGVCAWDPYTPYAPWGGVRPGGLARQPPLERQAPTQRIVVGPHAHQQARRPTRTFDLSSSPDSGTHSAGTASDRRHRT